MILVEQHSTLDGTTAAMVVSSVHVRGRGGAVRRSTRAEHAVVTLASGDMPRIEVLQEITGILIDTVGACAFEFILAIAT